MKKVLLSLLSLPFVVRAAQDLESMESETERLASEMPSPVPLKLSVLSWKAKLMLYWTSMSFMQKTIAAFVLGLIVLWIICKVMKCGTGGSCSCACGNGACGCHPK